MDTISKIKPIFYSGNEAFPGLIEPIQEIAFLIDEGYLSISAFDVSTKKDFLDFFNDLSLQKERVHSAAGGGITHVALKIFSGNYIERNRKLEVQYERSFCGYFPDVISKDESIIVECGLTQNPEKVLIYFLQGKIKEFIQVPYPTEESECLIGYSFLPRGDLNEFLAFMQEEKNSQIKNLLNIRRASR